MGTRVKCPRCGTETEYQGNPWRPFCSERCKTVDLGNWVSGRYRLPTKTEDEREDEDDPESPPSEGEL